MISIMASFPSHKGDDDDDDESAEKRATKLEEMFTSMGYIRERLYGEKDRKEAPKMKVLDSKHRKYFWAPTRACKGPAPTAAEQLEYRNDDAVKKRFRAIDDASKRLFIAENSSEDCYIDEHWQLIESAADDILTYQYAWVDIIVPTKKYSTNSLEAVRILFLYSHHLLVNDRYKNVSKALPVLNMSMKLLHGENEKNPGGLLETMKHDTGQDRFELCIQEYKQALYSCLAMAAIGHRAKAIEHFRAGMISEHGYRVQSGMEFKNGAMMNDPYDYRRMIEQLNGYLSLFWVVAEELDIPRQNLDDDFFESVDSHLIEYVYDLDDDKIWDCILSFGGVQDTEKNQLQFCEQCWIVKSDLKMCAKCELVCYCSRECQIKNWPSHKHSCVGRENEKK